VLEGLRQDLTQAVRRLRRSPGFALIAVATLAIGIGATTAIFSVVDAVLLRPLAYRDAGGLVALFALEASRGERRAPTSPADFLEWRKGSRTLQDLTAAHPWSPVLTGRGDAEELPGLKATPSLFGLLGVPPLLGRAFADAPGELQVVLGHAVWQRRFGGDPGVVGQSLVLDGRSYVVAGVMPPGFRFPPFWATEAELWTPLVFTREQETGHQRFLRVFGRLRPGETLAAARAEMDVVGERLAREWPRSNADVRVNVEALQEPVVSRVRPALLVLAGAVSLVLLIACANVASLLLAQGVAREKDAAVRAALGASRARLVGQGLAESVVLSLAGGLSGLLLARLAVAQVDRLGPARLPRVEEIAVDGRVAAFALALCLLTGIVSGLLPALRASRPSLVPSLKLGERLAGGARHRLHDLLVIAEFAMAVVLLVGAGLLAKSFLRLQRPETGFRAEGLLTVTLSLSGSPRADGDRRPAFLSELLDEVGTLPGVEKAAFVNHVPIGGDTWRTRLSVDGRPSPDPALTPQAVMRTASPGYLEAMGIPLLHGRDFDRGDRKDSAAVVLVNRALARKLWPEGDALGARIKLGRRDSDAPWRTIVGVFADARQADPTEPVQPEILFPYAQDPVSWYKGTTLVLRSWTPLLAIAPSVESRVRTTAPELPITRVRTMSELLSEAVAQDRLGALLMGLLSLVALALAVGGIYGVMAYAVGRRAHEIGVRMALGARPAAVEAMVLRDGLRLGLLGAASGLLGALALSRVLRRLLHEVSPTDPVIFAGVGLLLLAVAVLASLLPARRAARLDPVVVLREP
jgi:putative ABC transport system permease protein